MASNEDKFLYYKTHTGEYLAWGNIYECHGAGLPYGIWLVKENSSCNLEDRLIKEEDLKVPTVVARRLFVKEKIIEAIIQTISENEEKPMSWEDIACEVAKKLVPSKPIVNEKNTKGVRFRNGTHRNSSRYT